MTMDKGKRESEMGKTIKDRAARALDQSLDDAVNKRGIYTDKNRETLAAYLDGAIKLKASTVRAYCKYLGA